MTFLFLIDFSISLLFFFTIFFSHFTMIATPSFPFICVRKECPADDQTVDIIPKKTIGRVLSWHAIVKLDYDNNVKDFRLEDFRGRSLQLSEQLEELKLNAMEVPAPFEMFLQALYDFYQTPMTEEQYDTMEKSSVLPHVVASVLEDLTKFGLENIEEMDPSGCSFTVVIPDSLKRNHKIYFNLCHPQSVVSDLPEECTNRLQQRLDAGDRVVDVLELFRRQVSKCEEFWHEICQVDERCAVLKNNTERYIPPLSNPERYIHIEKNVVLLIKVDIKTPKERPLMRFLGPSTLCETWVKALDEYKWDRTKGLANNLIEAFSGSEITNKKTSDDSDDSDDEFDKELCCWICYEQQDENKEPVNVFCQNPKCGARYHTSCIQEQAPYHNVRTTGRLMITKCPNCNEDIQFTIHS